MRLQNFLLILGITCNPLAGEGFRLCVDDRVGIDDVAREAFEKEIDLLLKGTNVAYDPVPCLLPLPSGFIQLKILPAPRQDRKQALGLAYLSQSRVLPLLEVYVGRLYGYLEHPRTPYVIGRAMARVSVHELTHFLRQDAGHDESGFMQPKLAHWMLADPDPARFRLARSFRPETGPAHR
jgi:hypothetical protein